MDEQAADREHTVAAKPALAEVAPMPQQHAVADLTQVVANTAKW